MGELENNLQMYTDQMFCRIREKKEIEDPKLIQEWNKEGYSTLVYFDIVDDPRKRVIVFGWEKNDEGAEDSGKFQNLANRCPKDIVVTHRKVINDYNKNEYNYKPS